MEYGDQYFKWQKNVGKFGGSADLFKFSNYISSNDTVLDFGCGGGYLLKNIDCRRKVGIEINKYARKFAQRENDIEVYETIDLLEKTPLALEGVDVVISNHALEHVDSPLSEIIKWKRVLKDLGKVVVVTPFERDFRYVRNDKNMHLYTWTPQNMVNLFIRAGYEVEECQVIKHTWPKHYRWIAKRLGFNMFHFICRLKSIICMQGYQIRIVAKLNNAGMKGM